MRFPPRPEFAEMTSKGLFVAVNLLVSSESVFSFRLVWALITLEQGIGVVGLKMTL